MTLLGVMYSSSRVAGVLLFIGAAEFLVGMMIAESIYPYYSMSGNFISDLGATCRGGTCYIPPSSTIFNVSASLFGLLVLISTFFIWRAYRSRVLTPLIVLAGISVLGVGLFPETTGIVHGIVSFGAFFFGGIAAIIAYRILKPPASYISVVLGAITLAFLGLGFTDYDFGLGIGGMERMIVYPELIFVLGFGGYLMGTVQILASKAPATPESFKVPKAD